MVRAMVLVALATGCCGGVVASIGGCFVGYKKCIKPLVRRRVKEYIEGSLPEPLGGSKIEVHAVDFDAGGSLNAKIAGGAINNLGSFTAQYLATAESMEVFMETRPAVMDLVRLRGAVRTLEVSKLIVRDVNLTFEKHATLSSNVTELLKKVSERSEQSKSQVTLVLHHVEILGLQIEVPASGYRQGMKMKIPDIKFEYHSRFGETQLSTVVMVLLSDAFEAALASMGGTDAASQVALDATSDFLLDISSRKNANDLSNNSPQDLQPQLPAVVGGKQASDVDVAPGDGAVGFSPVVDLPGPLEGSVSCETLADTVDMLSPASVPPAAAGTLVDMSSVLDSYGAMSFTSAMPGMEAEVPGAEVPEAQAPEGEAPEGVVPETPSSFIGTITVSTSGNFEDVDLADREPEAQVAEVRRSSRSSGDGEKNPVFSFEESVGESWIESSEQQDHNPERTNRERRRERVKLLASGAKEKFHNHAEKLHGKAESVAQTAGGTLLKSKHTVDVAASTARGAAENLGGALKVLAPGNIFGRKSKTQEERRV